MTNNNAATLEGKELPGLLEVGLTALLFHDPNNSPKSATRAKFEGWRKGDYVSLDIVLEENRSRIFREGGAAIVRFVSDGSVYAFSTKFMDGRADFRDPTIRVLWPDEVKVMSLRQYQRVELNLPCFITHDTTKSEAELLDISEGGCRIATRDDYKVGDTLHLGFTLPDGSILHDVVSTVRNVDTEGKETMAGLSFDELSEKQKADIEFFVTSTILGGRTNTEGVPVILFLGEKRDEISAVESALQDGGFMVSHGVGAIEGFSKLRALTPSVLLVGENQADLPPESIIETVRATPFFAELPIVTYGAGLSAKKDQLGVQGHLENVADADTLIAELRRVLEIETPTEE